MLGAPSPRTRTLRLSSALLALLAPSAVLPGCADREAGEDTGSASEPVVYGNDDRQDVFAFTDRRWAGRAAGFSAALVDLAAVDATDPDNVFLPSPTLAETGVCPDERFADQLTAGFCSATLIGPDLMLTAGHCVSAGDCAGTGFVFDYSMTDESTLHAITSDDVYACQEVLVNEVAEADYAVVRLDREVVGRTPAPVDATPAPLPDRRRLLVNGYPSGLPLKIDNGARVRDARADTLDFFVANLDTFGGNSGSGVFDNRTRQLVGILVRGEQDYVLDEEAGCFRVNRCRNVQCSGEDSTYAFRAVEALCASGAPAPGLCPCGDGTCDAAGGESTSTCPFDCGTECGDGTCNGDESPSTCTADCGTCGNGACDGDETPDTCCTDCECGAEGDVCLENECVPDPFPGDSCEQPLELAILPTQTITGDTLFAEDDFAGSCVGEGAPDRVYAFTVTAPTSIEASASGFDTGLYLRAACDDAGVELGCNDDVEPGDVSSRMNATVEPGTYHLVVDGFDSGSLGPYTIDIAFTCVGDEEQCSGGGDDGGDGGAGEGGDGGAGEGGAGEGGAGEGGAGSGDDDDDDGVGGTDPDGDELSASDREDGGCSLAGRDGSGTPGGSMVSLWLLGMGAFGLRRRSRGRQTR